MRPLVLLLSIAIDFTTSFRFHVTCSYDGSAFRGWQVQESSNKLESSRTAYWYTKLGMEGWKAVGFPPNNSSIISLFSTTVVPKNKPLGALNVGFSFSR